MSYCRQCTIEKGTTTQVSWLPEEFAKVGKVLELKENNVWENGWVVTMVGGRKTKEQTNYDSQDHKRMVKKDA